MKSLVNALNNIALALESLAVSVQTNKKNNPFVSKQITSNNSPSPVVTKFSGLNNFEHNHTKKVVNAFNSSYDNRKKMDDLRQNWPELFYSLVDLSSNFQEQNNTFTNKDIWKK